MREAEILKSLDHPKIVKIIEFRETKKALFFILEFVEGGSLYKLLKKFGDFPESLISIYVGQVLDGLSYLHGKGIVHRDIKGGNILITKDGLVKLADFGTAKSVKSNKFTVVGTPYWMAPEIIEMSGGGTAADIWSVGCTIIELLTGTPPYFKLGTMTALFNMVQDDHPPLPQVSKECREFLLACFVKDFEKRPKAEDLLTHTFITMHQVKEKPLSLAEVNKTLRDHKSKSKVSVLKMDWIHSPKEPTVNVTKDRAGTVPSPEAAGWSKSGIGDSEKAKAQHALVIGNRAPTASAKGDKKVEASLKVSTDKKGAPAKKKKKTRTRELQIQAALEESKKGKRKMSQKKKPDAKKAKRRKSSKREDKAKTPDKLTSPAAAPDKGEADVRIVKRKKMHKPKKSDIGGGDLNPKLQKEKEDLNSQNLNLDDQLDQLIKDKTRLGQNKKMLQKFIYHIKSDLHELKEVDKFIETFEQRFGKDFFERVMRRRNEYSSHDILTIPKTLRRTNSF